MLFKIIPVKSVRTKMERGTSMHHLKSRRVFSWLVLLPPLFAFAPHLQAQAPRLVFDATAPPLTPQPVTAHLGTNLAPNGDEIAVNSQYLTRNGKPWIPVMGEFHFSRYPEAYWEEEILKMKASGVQVIATYVFWIHVEEIQGQFDWTGQRDLRKFASLCAKHGMLLYMRIGPWDHGEVRNGGLPDWVLKNSPVRSNNPVYLSEVEKFYAEIGRQLHGLLWKDGGPVIGIQIENEYSSRGPGMGREHLLTLKKMAISSGLDVPLYTVTGWDNADVPNDEFLPVYGGYPAAPWDGSRTVFPSSEVYAFRFASRISGDMGAQGGANDTSAHHDSSLRSAVPFLTAEVGGGIQDTYHRRPLLAPEDIEAMIPVVVGSGANLLGYYMYQGGENPDGKLTTLQESQRTGYPNDLPTKNYDFQAPLGEFGQMHPQLLELKLDHYFLNDFGSELAPARVVEPEPHPSNPRDTSVVRASLRIDGEHGFLFVNNYIREQKMPARPETQFEVKVPGKTFLIPATPVTVPANSFFYWPVNMSIQGIPMRYSTAQPILKTHSGGDDFIFFAKLPGIPVEFAFPAEFHSAIQANRGAIAVKGGLLRTQNVEPGREIALTVHGATGRTHLVVLSSEDAKCLWRITTGEHEIVLLTHAQVFSKGRQVVLRQIGDPDFDVAIFRPAPDHVGDPATVGAQPSALGLFVRVTRRLARKGITLQSTRIRDFGRALEPLVGPHPPWRQTGVAMTPEESSFAQAAVWHLTIPKNATDGLSDIYLSIHYQGDEARLLNGSHLIDDEFFNGAAWQIGLKRFLTEPAATNFTLEILPLNEKAHIFFEPRFAPRFDSNGQAGSLQSIEAIPEYEIDLPM